MTYTFIRAADGSRLVVPNDKLASDTILNSTIRSRETFAEITVQLPLVVRPRGRGRRAARGGRRRAALRRRSSSASTRNATVTVRAAAPDAAAALRLEGELRLRAHTRLRALGVFG